jgi:hypothetical protein
MKMKRLVFVVIIFLLLTVCAEAQTGPFRAVFPASVDHNVVEFQVTKLTAYELLVWDQTDVGATPMLTINMGKPTPDASNVITADINAGVITLRAGTYVARVRAVGPGGTSPTPSALSDPFPLQPGVPQAPGKPAIGRGQ